MFLLFNPVSILYILKNRAQCKMSLYAYEHASGYFSSLVLWLLFRSFAWTLMWSNLQTKSLCSMRLIRAGFGTGPLCLPGTEFCVRRRDELLEDAARVADGAACGAQSRACHDLAGCSSNALCHKVGGQKSGLWVTSPWLVGAESMDITLKNLQNAATYQSLPVPNCISV